MYYGLACAVICRACEDWVKGREYIASYTPKTKAQYYTLRDKWHEVRTAYNFFMSDNIWWDYTDYDRIAFIERLNITEDERKKYEALFKYKRCNYYLFNAKRQIDNYKRVRGKHLPRRRKQLPSGRDETYQDR